MLSDLLASLDLRFEDPVVESLYYNYYAQVKRQLLPTAIQVVLSVNVLQLCASCLHFYFLANDSTRPLSRPLILPFIIQLAILVLTCAMLKMVKNEINRSDRYGRRRFSSTGQAGTGGRNSKSNIKSNSRQSSGSGLSASLSLTIRAPLDQDNPSSESSESESSSSSSSDDERDPAENKMIQLNKTSSNKASNQQKKQNNRRSHSSSRHSKVSANSVSRATSPELTLCSI